MGHTVCQFRTISGNHHHHHHHQHLHHHCDHHHQCHHILDLWIALSRISIQTITLQHLSLNVLLTWSSLLSPGLLLLQLFSLAIWTMQRAHLGSILFQTKAVFMINEFERSCSPPCRTMLPCLLCSEWDPRPEPSHQYLCSIQPCYDFRCIFHSQIIHVCLYVPIDCCTFTLKI